MKKQIPNLFTTISKTEMISLTTEVKETIATDAFQQQKTFGSADLWNIQRKRRRAIVRKHEWMQAGF